MARQLKILMAFEHYPCSIGRFWQRGFEALGHTVHTTGHSTGGRIGWGDQYDLSRWTHTPTYPLASFSNVYEVGLITHRLSADYDLFVNVDAAHWWRGPTACPKVIVGTDGHCLDYSRQRQDCDLFVGMHRFYNHPGDYWIPYAHDPEWHRRLDLLDTHDVTFWGVEYAERKADLDELERAGLRVVRGTGRVFAECAEDYSTGPLAYCRPSLQDLPARFFEGLAHGAIPLTTWAPDLALFSEFADGWHYQTYDGTPRGLVEQARRTLADPGLPRRRQAALEAVQPHTWQARAQELLDECARRGLVDLESAE